MCGADTLLLFSMFSLKALETLFVGLIADTLAADVFSTLLITLLLSDSDDSNDLTCDFVCNCPSSMNAGVRISAKLFSGVERDLSGVGMDMTGVLRGEKDTHTAAGPFSSIFCGVVNREGMWRRGVGILFVLVGFTFRGVHKVVFNVEAIFLFNWVSLHD